MDTNAREAFAFLLQIDLLECSPEQSETLFETRAFVYRALRVPPAESTCHKTLELTVRSTKYTVAVCFYHLSLSQ